MPFFVVVVIYLAICGEVILLCPMLEIGRYKAFVHFHKTSVVVGCVGGCCLVLVKLPNCELMQKLVIN